MDAKEKKQLETHVREKILELTATIESYKVLSEPVAPDDAIGRLTRMEAINSKSMSEAALNKAKLTLSKIKKNLKLIDDEEFGLCYECEEPIPFKRLMIMPETDLCVQCAKKITID